MAYHTPPSPRLLMPCNAKLLAIAQSRHACAFTVVLSLCNVHVMVNIDVVANGPPLACTVRGGRICKMGIEGCEGNGESRRRVRQSVIRHIVAFPCSFGQTLSGEDAGYKPALPEGVDGVRTGTQSVARGGRLQATSSRYSDHADAGYKPALPEDVDCADGHTVCGEKHRIANETAKEIGHADAGYKPALPDGHTV